MTESLAELRPSLTNDINTLKEVSEGQGEATIRVQSKSNTKMISDLGQMNNELERLRNLQLAYTTSSHAVSRDQISGRKKWKALYVQWNRTSEINSTSQYAEKMIAAFHPNLFSEIPEERNEEMSPVWRDIRDTKKEDNSDGEVDKAFGDPPPRQTPVKRRPGVKTADM